MAQRRIRKKRRQQRSFLDRINPLYLLAVFFAGLLVVALGIYLTQPGSSLAPAANTLVAKSQPSENIPYPNVPRITPAEAKAKLDRQEIFVVDSRSAQEFADSHIAGAVSIPLPETEQRLTQLPKDKEIVTYCT